MFPYGFQLQDRSDTILDRLVQTDSEYNIPEGSA